MSHAPSHKIGGVEINASVSDEFAKILSPDALEFVAMLCRKFEARRRELLERRIAVQADLDAGKLPQFLPETNVCQS